MVAFFLIYKLKNWKSTLINGQPRAKQTDDAYHGLAVISPLNFLRVTGVFIYNLWLCLTATDVLHTLPSDYLRKRKIDFFSF